MNTKLYKVILDKIIDSGLSKRRFAEKYDINRAWLIDFMDPNKASRTLEIQTIGMLKRTLGIDPELCYDYNKQVLEERKS